MKNQHLLVVFPILQTHSCIPPYDDQVSHARQFVLISPILVMLSQENFLQNHMVDI